MKIQLKDIAQRMKALREILEISLEDMAADLSVTTETLEKAENGDIDLGITFLSKFATRCDVDITELLNGKASRLSLYQVVRGGQGIEIERREGFKYNHLGYLLKGRHQEPLKVVAPYVEGNENATIHFSTHDGFEFDYILKGSLKISVDGKEEILNEGDSIFYDSSKKHGMVAVGGTECEFLAILMR